MPGRDVGVGSARRCRERRRAMLRHEQQPIAMALATAFRHSAHRSKGWEEAVYGAPRGQSTTNRGRDAAGSSVGARAAGASSPGRVRCCSSAPPRSPAPSPSSWTAPWRRRQRRRSCNRGKRGEGEGEEAGGEGGEAAECGCPRASAPGQNPAANRPFPELGFRLFHAEQLLLEWEGLKKKEW